jgi:hypothetical protein
MVSMGRTTKYMRAYMRRVSICRRMASKSHRSHKSSAIVTVSAGSIPVRARLIDQSQRRVEVTGTYDDCLVS